MPHIIFYHNSLVPITIANTNEQKTEKNEVKIINKIIFYDSCSAQTLTFGK